LTPRPAGTTTKPFVSEVQLLELDVTADPGVLLRVVSLCHKRGIQVASLQYESAPGSGRILLGVRGDATAVRRARLWLDAIIPVLAIRVPGAAASLALTRVTGADSALAQSPPPLGTLAP
jgi:acetolactate synthase small subunit